MNDLISIIIPMYNVEKYLSECLNSIVNQTYESIEIVLIDDGSTDNSYQIAEKFKQMNPAKSIQLLKKSNGGQSSARNLGIQNASGEYIIFVDSDDYVEPTHVEELYNAVITEKAMVAMCKFTKNILELGEKNLTTYNIVAGTFEKLVNELYTSSYPAVAPVCKIYHKSLFDKVKFAEGIIYEDGILFYEIVDQIDQIILVDSISYYYRTTENSTLTKKIGEKNFDVLKKNEITEDFFKRRHPEALEHFYQKALNLNDFIAVKCIQDNTELGRKLIKEIYMSNKRYAKNLFPRKLLYTSAVIYYPFLYIMSLLYKQDNVGKESVIKKIIKKTAI